MDKAEISILHQPEDIVAHFVDSWNKKDARKLASVFDESADFINVTGLWWHNRTDIQKAHDYGFKVIFPESELTVLDSRIKTISDTAAVVHAKMKLTGQSPKSSQKPSVRRTIFTFVLNKQGSGWTCVSAHNTDIVPGTETNIIEGNRFKSVSYR
jgi:uncharacterized protein (TIGR02246 family)